MIWSGKTFLLTAILGYIYTDLQIKHYSGDYRQFFTAETDYGNSLSTLGTPSAVTIYSMYLRLKLSAKTDLKFSKP